MYGLTILGRDCFMENDWETLFKALNNVNEFSQSTLSKADTLYNSKRNLQGPLLPNLRNAELQKLHWRALWNRHQMYFLILGNKTRQRGYFCLYIF